MSWTFCTKSIYAVTENCVCLNQVPPESVRLIYFKDGAYYCYCAYLLRISRYSSFLSVMLTDTEIFLRGLKLSVQSRSS